MLVHVKQLFFVLLEDRSDLFVLLLHIAEVISHVEKAEEKCAKKDRCQKIIRCSGIEENKHSNAVYRHDLI